MQVQDQSDVVDFLSKPESYGETTPVTVIETHISLVFLIGGRAFKLKRAVHLPYVDFSTTAIRLSACETELSLNRRTTPEIYLGVRRITESTEGLEFDGDGVLIDAVVEMVRFDADALLENVAKSGGLSENLTRALADNIRAAHLDAEVKREDGAANIAAVLDINRAGFGESSVFTPDEIAAIDGAFRAAHDGQASRLAARGAAGFIRRCHGDLHLGNVFLWHGEPRLFDCIDFNDRLATVDVLYDLAFMAMDLWDRDLPHLASLLVNRYFDASERGDGFALMPFFLALRAAVRAHVTATQADTAQDAAKKTLARDYYDLAMTALQPAAPRLVAIGGLSGSGKSTLAEALAPEIGAPPGARLIESDRTRKAMYGVSPKTRLPDDAYAPDISDKVYSRMAEQAATLLRAGCSVIVDAVHDAPDRRLRIAQVAQDVGVPFDGLWLDASPETLRARVAARGAGASDATVAVLDRQLARLQPVDDWTHVKADPTPSGALSNLRAALARDRR